MKPLAVSACLLSLLLGATTPCLLAVSTPPAAENAAPAQKHALRGVVTGLLPDRSSVLVKHEAIPGVMRAMTMAFKVDAPTLARLKEGDAITGLMSRQGSSWILEDVKPATSKQP